MAVVKIDDTMGAAFVGLIVGSMLYGITNVQTYLYYVNYPRDRMGLKVLVGVLWVLDTTHVMAISEALYHYLIKNYGNPAALTLTVWTYVVQILLTTIVAFIVQVFLVMRVWKISRQWWVAVPLLIESCVAFAFGVAYFVKIQTLPSLLDVDEVVWIIETSLATAVVADSSITLCLCYYLHRSRTGLTSTDTMINKLLLYTVNTGLLTSICAMADLIIHATVKQGQVYLSLYFILGKLYANSLLATLNARASLAGRDKQNDGLVEEPSTSGPPGYLSFRTTPSTLTPSDTTKHASHSLFVSQKITITRGDGNIELEALAEP